MDEIELCTECGAPDNYVDRLHLLRRALDALEFVHNADQTTDKRGVLVDMPQALERARAVLREAGRLDGDGVAFPGSASGVPGTHETKENDRG